jgi:GNAT superfamily N-acetyltransferase
MARQLRPLASDDLAMLPAGCGACLFWELGTPAPDDRAVGVLVGAPREDPPARPADRKRAWVSSRVEAGAAPGRVAVVDGEVAGYALFGPSGAFARRRPPVPAVSPNVVLLATAWVHPSRRDGGIGRLFVQAAMKEAIRHDLAAVEAYGDRRFHERSCVLPAMWLLHEGFEVHREHPRTPLFRLDVRRTVRWADSLEHALGEVLEHLPKRSPVPVPERFEPSGPATG